MKFIYEKGDKVVVLETGAHEIVKDVRTPWPNDTYTLEGLEGPFRPEELRPVFDTAVLRAESGKVHRIFLGLPNTFLQEPGSDGAVELANYYNQAYDPDDESDYETVWVENLDQIKAIIREANGDFATGGDEPMSCDECGQDMLIQDDGVSHHIDEAGNVNHDQDADHVAVNRAAAGDRL